MSIFSRRAREAQDDSKNKEQEQETPADAPEGGLFGAIKLGPPDESSVPPPEDNFVAQREVPSLEDARAEFDRARAEMSAGLSGGAPQFDDDSPRESVSFGAVTLPLVTPETAPHQSEHAAQSVFAPQSPLAPTEISSTGAESNARVEYNDLADAADSSPTAPVVASQSPEVSSEFAANVEKKTTPSARAGNNSDLTPFQRLMAARAAQSGLPAPRLRVERPAPVAEPAAQVEAPQSETSLTETPQVEAPQSETSLTETPQVEAPQTENSATEAPIAEISVI